MVPVSEICREDNTCEVGAWHGRAQSPEEGGPVSGTAIHFL